MSVTTKRLSAVREPTVAGKAAPTKAAAKTAAHILQPAKGPRTVSHRKIKEAVDKVFRERSLARG